MTPGADSPLRRALFRALHDPLTGLPNQALLGERMVKALARARRHGTAVAVVLFDLDRFKLVNDSLGHTAGDEVLVEMARRVEASVRSTDSIARVGGDQFAVLLEDVSDRDQALALAERLRQRVAEPAGIAGGERVVVTASVGIALSAGGDDLEPAELLRDAEAAMYRAKDRGRDRIELYEDGLRTPVFDRLRAELLLRQALDHHRLRLHYQPIVDVAGGGTVGAEALVRVDDGAGGLVEPDRFLPAAEESGLVVPLGAWVVAEACRQAARWSRDGDRFWVSINLSARQLASPGFLGQVASAIESSGAPATHLCFEVTETALYEATGASLRALAALKDSGARLAIDDFGTGQASLVWLRRLPADVLKIDSGFVAGVGRDPGDTAIVGAVLGFARSLGLTTVAEGVETPGQLAALRDLGCDLAQGFHFARPGPAEAITERLGAGRAA